MLATNYHSWHNECDTCFDIDIALDSIDYDFNGSNVTVDTLDLHGLLDSKQALTHVLLLAPAIASPFCTCLDFAVHLLVEYNYV
jgi:hypothetical protein